MSLFNVVRRCLLIVSLFSLSAGSLLAQNNDPGGCPIVTFCPCPMNAPPCIREVYTSLGPAGQGCGLAGAGTRVRIVGCIPPDARIFVGPKDRPELMSEQKDIDRASQSSTEISFNGGQMPDGVIEIRSIFGTACRCFKGISVPRPLIYDFDPKQIPIGRTTLVYIYGGGLFRVNEVSINGTKYPILFLRQGLDTTTSPPRILDTIGIEISTCTNGRIVVLDTRSNQADTSASAVTCIPPPVPQPAISDFSPRSGGMGTQVTITGSNLESVTRVRIGRIEVSSFVVEAGRLIVTVGRGATGTIELSSLGGTTVSQQEFTFVPAPTINDISPTDIGPFTPVIISGANLQNVRSITFGTFPNVVVPARIIPNANGTQVTAIMGTSGTINSVFPFGDVSNQPVQLSTPGGIATARQRVRFVPLEFSLPNISLRPANARNGARIDGNRLLLRERVSGFFPPKAAEGGDVLIERRGWNSNLNILVNLTYRSSTGTVWTLARGGPHTDKSLPDDVLPESLSLPIPPTAKGENVALLANFPMRNGDNVDGLQGDLGASARTRGTQLLLPGNNGIPMAAQNDFTAYDSASMSFRARWSEQSYITNPDNLPQTPALQGRRTLTIELVDPENRDSYSINPTARSVTVVLDDPDPSASVRVVNPIADKMLAPGMNDIVELEFPGNTPSARNNGSLLPNAVFLDETYSLLQYSATTSDPALIQGLKIETFQSALRPRPRLQYQLSPTARSGACATITVTASNGRGGSTTNTFTVCVLQGAPSVERVEPSAAAPGAEVRIIGRDLANLRSVTFSANTAGSGTNTSVVAEIVSTSADVIVVRVPNTAQTGALTVTTRIGTTQTQSFTVIRTPQIRGFVPDSATRGTVIRISGVNLSGVNAVSFGGVSAEDFTVLSDTLITARVRNGATGAIMLTNPRESVVSTNIFTIIPPPLIASVSPQVGGAGTEVTLTGENFTGAGFMSPDTVLLNGRPVSIMLRGASRLTFFVPDFGLTAQNGLSIVLRTRGGSTTASVTFNFTPCPRLERFTPQSGSPLDSITLFGANLLGVTAVRIGGVAVRGFRIVSPSEIRVAVGSVNTGRVLVSSAMCSDSSSTTFTYNAPARPLLMTLSSFPKIFPNDITSSTITLMNLASTPMTLTLGIAQDSEGNFAITAPTQAFTLQRNEIAQATVRFAPRTSGIKTARLTASGQGLTAPVDTGISAQAGVWQVLPTTFDTVRVGRNTVRAAVIVNRNLVASKLDAVRLTGDNGFSITGTMPAWVGAGDSIAAIVRALPNTTRTMQGNISVESAGLDTGRASITAFAREQRGSDIVMETSLATDNNNVEAGQNVALRMNLRIQQNATDVPNVLQVRGSVRWNRNVLLAQTNPNTQIPPVQGVVRSVRNLDVRNATLRTEIVPQTPHQSWTGGSSVLLISIPLGVYYGETNVSSLEIEELSVIDASQTSISAPRRIFVEEPQNSTFTAKNFGRFIRSSTASTLNVISPSPASASANVRYTITDQTAILLTLVDVHGKRIKTIAEGWRDAGVFEHTFDISDVPTGTYFVMLHTARDRASKTLRVIR
jgi:hypothetical protein